MDKSLNQLVKEFQVAHEVKDTKELSTVDFIFASVSSIIKNHRMNVFSRFFLLRKVRMLQKLVLNTITEVSKQKGVLEGE